MMIAVALLNCIAYLMNFWSARANSFIEFSTVSDRIAILDNNFRTLSWLWKKATSTVQHTSESAPKRKDEGMSMQLAR